MVNKNLEVYMLVWFMQLNESKQFWGTFNGKYLMRCAIWYNSYNLKNVKNTHGGVLILVQLQAVSLRIQSECGKIRNRKNSVFGHFSRSKFCNKWKLSQAYNFPKSNIFPWVFFTFFKLHKWYQIVQRITVWGYNFNWFSPAMKQLLENVPALSQFFLFLK